MQTNSDPIRLNYQLLPAQKKFFNTEIREEAIRRYGSLDNVDLISVDCYQGGVGSGKTWSGDLLGLLLCKKWGPRIHKPVFLSTAATYGMLSDTTIPQYIDHLEKMGYEEGRHFYFRSSPLPRLVIKAWNDVTIRFRSLENPNKIKSINAFASQIEEASEVTRAAFREVIFRTRQVGPDVHRVYLHTNPQAEKSWIYEMFVEKGGYVEEQDPNTGRMALIHYRRVIAPTIENKHLSSAYLLNLKTTLDPESYKMFALGQDGNYSEGLVVKHFSSENIDEAVEHDPKARLHLTCDFNVDPMSWATFHRSQGRYDFFDEIVVENTNVTDAVAEFARRYPVEKVLNGITINGDASGQSRSDMSDKPNDTRYKLMRRLLMNEYGYPDVKIAVRKANPPIESRVEAFNAKICNANGEVFIRFNPRCKWAIKNLESLKYKEGTSDFDLPNSSDIKRDSQLKFMGHIFDAISYPVEYYDSIVKSYKKQESSGNFYKPIEFDV